MLLGACAGSGDPSADHGGHAASEEVAAPVEGAGETLHDFTLEQAGFHLNVAPGDTVTTSLTIDEPGTYEAKCTVPGHAEAGMTIEVSVT